MRALGLVLLALVAPLVQVVLVNRSPWGGPDLVVLAVVWAALARGPVWGCVAGLVAGLAADVTPPADGTVGRTALVLSVTGLLAGRLRASGRPYEGGSAGRPLLAGGLGAVLGTVLQVAAAVALGDEPWRTALAGPPAAPASWAALTLAWTVALGAAGGVVVARRRPSEGTKSQPAPRRV
ncbi:rod shape-determining protein MreD [Nonomuraea sp. PA05]|uniref:rod shape-determining protein MreD n=1 Tax=Nonomuraea sp. PA05 TaxID=2604466 RepID=UPI0011D34B6E|nr:rod shape-determining protein MreD [Nonomuraea sp. PA05]TYB63839.1 rod shape-determining protein MreD [Nonomuraea sp. PA05]